MVIFLYTDIELTSWVSGCPLINPCITRIPWNPLKSHLVLLYHIQTKYRAEDCLYPQCPITAAVSPSSPTSPIHPPSSRKVEAYSKLGYTWIFSCLKLRNPKILAETLPAGKDKAACVVYIRFWAYAESFRVLGCPYLVPETLFFQRKKVAVDQIQDSVLFNGDATHSIAEKILSSKGL